jgi:RNA polymerase sigma factor (sigma-70 family)
MATNLSLNHLRTRRREQAAHLRLAEANSEKSAGSGRTDVPSASDWSYWLNRLDESQRAAIVLFHFEQMSYADVAETIGKPVNTVRTLLYRGRQRLRELMTRSAGSEKPLWNVAM